TMISGDFLYAPNGVQANETDRDWQIVGTADLNGDGKPDLLWRHCTLGLNVGWFLNNNYVTGSTYLSRQEFDTDWRVASQDTQDTVWRLQTADFTWLRAAVNLTAPNVALTYKLPLNVGFGATVQRRLSTDTNWTTLASGVMTDSYLDTSATLGRA